MLNKTFITHNLLSNTVRYITVLVTLISNLMFSCTPDSIKHVTSLRGTDELDIKMNNKYHRHKKGITSDILLGGKGIVLPPISYPQIEFKCEQFVKFMLNFPRT